MATSRVSSQYKAVLFDYGGVWAGDIPELFRSILGEEERKRSYTPGTLFKGTELDKRGGTLDRLFLGEITYEEVARTLDDWMMKKTGNRSHFETLIEDKEEELYRQNAEMVYAHKVLKENGFKTGILSNNMIINAKGEKMLRVDRSAFDVVIDSCEVHLRKPDPEIYQLALDELGVRANEVIFLDDFDENLEGARKLGIRAIKVSVASIDDAITELGKEVGLDLISGRC